MRKISAYPTCTGQKETTTPRSNTNCSSQRCWPSTVYLCKCFHSQKLSLLSERNKIWDRQNAQTWISLWKFMMCANSRVVKQIRLSPNFLIMITFKRVIQLTNTTYIFATTQMKTEKIVWIRNSITKESNQLSIRIICSGRCILADFPESYFRDVIW